MVVVAGHSREDVVVVGGTVRIVAGWSVVETQHDENLVVGQLG